MSTNQDKLKTKMGIALGLSCGGSPADKLRRTALKLGRDHNPEAPAEYARELLALTAEAGNLRGKGEIRAWLGLNGVL